MYDNDMHSALDIAALENKEDIVTMLDAARNEQTRKNPKVVQKLKENAVKDAERNRRNYERYFRINTRLLVITLTVEMFGQIDLCIEHGNRLIQS